ncbi:TIGR01212 family radical SAM protein [Eubacterium sp.]|uniref:TIGR01212 family radical SAM protein n=1 Tax=Eubacterium sp. TaxID=142586 RepID=UPI0025E6764A|nr:TIGR01212 family radical SAM protein [Eubacterium sp.]MCR5630190.1 TIGR01212 family radical SAM protein [Eubacterium sp.]
MEYYSLNKYLKDTYGRKLYKISIDAGFTCPNRDGLIDTKGCIFCSGKGSGDFAEDRICSITQQIQSGKQRIIGKMPKNINENEANFIAYFQAYTNTYASVEVLRDKYREAYENLDIAILSIATRPDCINEEVVSLLSEINKIKPVWVELGLQTIHEKSANYIRRGYDLSVYDEAVKLLCNEGIEVITHVILGLPGETKEDMLETVKYVGESGAKGIKLQLLHVLKGTDLAGDYEEGKFKCLEMNEYIDIICSALKVLPEDMVIHRMTGDGAKKDLIAPLWSMDKKRVLNSLNKAISEAKR